MPTVKTFAMLLTLVSSLALAQSNSGQPPIDTRQSATRAEQITCQSTSQTAQITTTITPPSAMRVYLVSFEISQQATTAPAASAYITTSTNFFSKRWQCGLAAVAGSACVNSFFPSVPVASQTPGTAVTFVGPAAVTNVNFVMDVCYYFAN